MQLTSVDDYIDQQLLVPRIGASVLAGFSLTALVLAALGLYAVVAFAVRERTKEVGIRIALGAHGAASRLDDGARRAVHRRRRTGHRVARGAGRRASASTVLFNVSPTDPATLVVVTAVLTLVAVAAAWIPAMRATRVDPAVALRVSIK